MRQAEGWGLFPANFGVNPPLGHYNHHRFGVLDADETGVYRRPWVIHRQRHGEG